MTSTSAPTPAAVRGRGERGAITVTSTPWGRVYVDGKLVADETPRTINVAPGRHHVRVTNGRAQDETWVEVAPGARVPWNAKLTR